MCIRPNMAPSDWSPLLPTLCLATSCLLPVDQCFSSFFFFFFIISPPGAFLAIFPQLSLPLYDILIPQMYCLFMYCVPACALCIEEGFLVCKNQFPSSLGVDIAPVDSARCRFTLCSWTDIPPSFQISCFQLLFCTYHHQKPT